MDPHEESSPIHPSSTSEVHHTISNDQHKDDQVMARKVAAIA